jgi:hypothetical protein
MVVLYTSKHRVPFIVDDDEKERISNITWYIDKCGNVVTNTDKRLLQNYILGKPPQNKMWCFINGDRHDCQRHNLQLGDNRKRNLTSSGVYVIRNTKTGKVYVGSSIKIKRTWKLHRFNLRKNSHTNYNLQRAWNIDGESSFQFEILEILPLKELIEKEQHYIDTMDCYNIRPAGNVRGFKSSRMISREIRICDCGEEFIVRYDSGQKFCSQECYWEYGDIGIFTGNEMRDY